MGTYHYVSNYFPYVARSRNTMEGNIEIAYDSDLSCIRSESFMFKQAPSYWKSF